MGIVVAVSNTQVSYPLDVISQVGALATASLIVSLFIALMISDSRYWDKRASSTLDVCTNPLFVTLAAIVIFKIMLVI